MRTEITLLALLFVSTLSYACTCAGLVEIPVLKRLNSTEKVFEGQVTEVTEKNEFSLITTFQITRQIKGVRSMEYIQVESSNNGAMCGIRFDVGERWLVFSNSGYTGLCSGNIRLTGNTFDDNDTSYANEHYQFYFSKLKKFLNLYAERKLKKKLVEHDEAGNLIAKGTLGKDNAVIGDWYYMVYGKEEIVKGGQ
ncbi:MAG: hypothetical protein KTR22_05105 [Flavobacteriaceae bacterium]|nr:hypothetical protein [Flavobacteriaceae bacterium]